MKDHRCPEVKARSRPEVIANGTAWSHNKTDGKLIMRGRVRATINNEGEVS